MYCNFDLSRFLQNKDLFIVSFSRKKKKKSAEAEKSECWKPALSKSFGEKCKYTELALNFVQKQCCS